MNKTHEETQVNHQRPSDASWGHWETSERRVPGNVGNDGYRKMMKMRSTKSWKSWIWYQYLPENMNGILVDMVPISAHPPTNVVGGWGGGVGISREGGVGGREHTDCRRIMGKSSWNHKTKHWKTTAIVGSFWCLNYWEELLKISVVLCCFSLDK